MTPITNHFSTLPNLAPVPTDPIKLYDRHSNCIDLKENQRLNRVDDTKGLKWMLHEGQWILPKGQVR